jgi:YHS domain-containing protein
LKGFARLTDPFFKNINQSRKQTKQTIFSIMAALTIAVSSDAADPGGKSLVLKTKDGLAIQGYDPVAYFTDNKALKGSTKFSSEYDGAKYLFASAEHKVLFDGDPAKYAPAYGGYCGYAASINRLSPISPEWFQIKDGKLILQHNKKAFDLFNKELRANALKADSNWAGLVAKNGVFGGKTLAYTDTKGIALGGYDPVTYFSDGQPKKGDSKIEATFNGALYHLVSQDNRATFEKDPTKYSPAYGGFCGYAASIGKVRPADPLIWSIVGGQLILQHTKGADELWKKNVADNKAKADKYWPLLVAAKAGKKDPVDSLLGKSVLDLAKIN